MKRILTVGTRTLTLSVIASCMTILMVVPALADNSFIARFSVITTITSTVPPNGDVNPYGLVRVPVTKGKLIKNRYLVSNFNNSQNLQGTGTTIVQIGGDGTFSLFAQIDTSKVSCPGGIGLTTALVALQSGHVIVGSLPTADGTAASAKAGCLIVLNSDGQVVETISGHHINGPWDMTAVEGPHLAALFVTNVLNGTVAANGNAVNGGTVVRLLLRIRDNGIPKLLDSTVIGSGFPERTDPAALVIGPTGVAFSRRSGTLFVADSLSNRVAAIDHALVRFTSAGNGRTVSQGGALNDPLAMSLAPNGHILTANGDDGNIVETVPQNGKQVAVKLVDNSGGPPPGSGALFGILAGDDEVFFVDDATNTLNVLH